MTLPTFPHFSWGKVFVLRFHQTHASFCSPFGFSRVAALDGAENDFLASLNEILYREKKKY